MSGTRDGIAIITHPWGGSLEGSDSLRIGLNLYGYVRGFPTTATDSSWHQFRVRYCVRTVLREFR